MTKKRISYDLGMYLLSIYIQKIQKEGLKDRDISMHIVLLRVL
jgi:hypothetical protein